MGNKPCCAAEGDDKVQVMEPETGEAQAGEEEALPVVDPVVEGKARELERVEGEAQPAPEPMGLQFCFLADSGEKFVMVPSRPLGLLFEKKLPIIVEGFNDKGSKAKELGIMAGWKLKSVGGADLTGVETYADALAIIQKHMQTLPEAS
mmetsp:Transcript_155603/g.274820  ORF Transcript_155603/g.274820 Transcript_155603/m.274820 type:complete len:149 (+) Transcript_155603:80-526(+)